MDEETLTAECYKAWELMEVALGQALMTVPSEVLKFFSEHADPVSWFRGLCDAEYRSRKSRPRKKPKKK